MGDGWGLLFGYFLITGLLGAALGGWVWEVQYPWNRTGPKRGYAMLFAICWPFIWWACTIPVILGCISTARRNRREGI